MLLQYSVEKPARDTRLVIDNGLASSLARSGVAVQKDMSWNTAFRLWLHSRQGSQLIPWSMMRQLGLAGLAGLTG
jgi:hypothetical protein